MIMRRSGWLPNRSIYSICFSKFVWNTQKWPTAAAQWQLL